MPAPSAADRRAGVTGTVRGAPATGGRRRRHRRRAGAELRALVVVVAALTSAAACGSEDEATGPGPSTTAATLLLDGGTTAPSGVAPEQGGSSTADGGVAGGSGDGGASTGLAGSGDADGSGGGGSAPGSGGGGAPSATLDPSGPPSSFARDVLRPDRSQAVVLEVQVAPGAEPSAATIEHVRATLAAATGKPVSVTTGSAPADTAWTRAGVQQAADAGATTAQGGGTAVLRLLFLDGTYEGNTGVLGVAVRGDVAAVFTERATSAAGLLGDPQAILASVATHEVGHLLGLVDLVLATGRADPEHPGHSANRGSVMYWAVESDLVASVLGARPPRDFDADDLADLRAIAAGG